MASTAISPAARPLAGTHDVAAKPRRAGVSWLALLRAWHLLSLDAPTVAAVWLVLFLPREPWRAVLPQVAALALAVWLFYAGDRVLDAAREKDDPLEARHRFHARHRRGFLAAAGLLVPVVALLLFQVPAETRLAWLLLAVPMALYALAVHRWTVQRMPKELVVAIMFATATAAPALLADPGATSHMLLFAGLFGAVCWLNGVAIARWERGGAPTASHLTAWGVLHLRGLLAAVACAACAVVLCVPAAEPALACALSAVLLLLLDRGHGLVEPVALRALADAALLTPLLFLFVR